MDEHMEGRIQKRQVCVSIAPEILNKVDEMAFRNGFGRSEVLRRAIAEFVNKLEVAYSGKC